MTLIKLNRQKLESLTEFLKNLPPHLFTQGKELLNEATIGQHFRHIIEFYVAIEKGVNTNIISYDDRERNLKIETDIHYAIETINGLISFLIGLKDDKNIILKADYNTEDGQSTLIQTTLFRELAYAHDHTVHHLAIIKIALLEDKESIKMDANFGVAPSTIRYKKQMMVDEK